MLRRATSVLLTVASVVAFGMAGTGAAVAARTIECQHPVTTGVEIGQLKNVTARVACPVALALYKYENSGHIPALYGCRPVGHKGLREPFLKEHSFDGWQMSLRGPYHYDFTFSRGDSSFGVGGTDFPVNCS